MEVLAVPVGIIAGGFFGFWGGVIGGLLLADRFDSDELEGAFFGAMGGTVLGAVILGTLAARGV